MKHFVVIALFVLIFTGCSNDEQYREEVETLKEEIEQLHQQLEEKENENNKTIILKDSEYIKIAKDYAPRLWRTPDVQLWDYVIDFSFAEENGWRRGTTKWREWEEDINPLFTTPNKSWQMPGLLMISFVSELQKSYQLGYEVWEITQRIDSIDENTAEGYILSYGFKDDSVSGSDFKITMKRENNHWYIKGVKVRDHCGRNVGKDKDLCT